jgi:hypothetical protein
MALGLKTTKLAGCPDAVISQTATDDDESGNRRSTMPSPCPMRN